MCSVVRQAEHIVGKQLLSLEDVYIQRLRKKLNLILLDDSHPANKYFQMLPSGRRMRHLKVMFASRTARTHRRLDYSTMLEVTECKFIFCTVQYVIHYVIYM